MSGDLVSRLMCWSWCALEPRAPHHSPLLGVRKLNKALRDNILNNISSLQWNVQTDAEF
jgi:hypothetical protein